MKIEHIAMYVNNIETAKNFFVKYFNAVSDSGYHNPQNRFPFLFSDIFGQCKIGTYDDSTA